jgi:hypothetical protein
MPISRLPLSDWLGSSTSPPFDHEIELVIRSHDGAGGPGKRGRRGGRSCGYEKLSPAPAGRRFTGGRRGFGGFLDRLLEGRQCRLDRLLRQVAGDEHHAGAAVLARPLRQQHRRMKQMLHSVQHDRPVGVLVHRNNCLEPQEVVAAHRRQRVEPAGQHPPRDRPLTGDAKGADAVVVPVGIRMAVVLVTTLQGFVAQPAPHVDAFCRRVEETEVEQQGRIDRTMRNRDQRGARIERSEPHLEGLPRAGLGEIGLGQQKAVGDRRLLDGCPCR